MGSQEEKDQVLKKIEKRQKDLFKSEGVGLNLHIFAEGFTTNNTHILPFKRGVFSSLLPVRPIALKYSSAYFNPSHDVMPMSIHMIMLLSQISNHIEVTELPIFGPNEYLFKTHLKPGEEKWMAYSRAVRESIADVLKLPIGEGNLKDKMECKSIYSGKDIKTD